MVQKSMRTKSHNEETFCTSKFIFCYDTVEGSFGVLP